MITCDPTVSVGTVLLHAYRIHGDIKLAVHIVKSVLISSVYAAGVEVGSPCKNSLKMEQSVRKQPWWMWINPSEKLIIDWTLLCVVLCVTKSIENVCIWYWHYSTYDTWNRCATWFRGHVTPQGQMVVGELLISDSRLYVKFMHYLLVCECKDTSKQCYGCIDSGVLNTEQQLSIRLSSLKWGWLLEAKILV